MKYTILVAALVVGACASPTMPTPSVAQAPAQKSVDPPAADPAPPPLPTPPAPTPTPAPDPAPVPVPRTILRATVTSSHWYPDATFTLPDRFEVVIERGSAKIAGLDPLPFAYYKDDDDFIVKPRDFQFVVRAGTFTFSGLAGDATGTIAK